MAEWISRKRDHQWRYSPNLAKSNSYATLSMIKVPPGEPHPKALANSWRPRRPGEIPGVDQAVNIFRACSRTVARLAVPRRLCPPAASSAVSPGGILRSAPRAPGRPAMLTSDAASTTPGCIRRRRRDRCSSFLAPPEADGDMAGRTDITHPVSVRPAALPGQTCGIGFADPAGTPAWTRPADRTTVLEHIFRSWNLGNSGQGAAGRGVRARG